MASRIYLYPGWLRVWHWTNALLFLLLILSGASMHYAQPGGLLIPFETAVSMHNICGITLSFMYLFFVLGSLISGNIKQYIPNPRGILVRLFNQAKYYLFGIFVGAPHPTHATLEEKFNALQQITYLQIMYGLVPIIIVSGWALLFPELAPEKFLGAGGIWPMAILHSVMGFFGALFMMGHFYLATTGDTVLANFKGMLTGWHNTHTH